jgi:outer membrane biosynthesis protein TonB
MQKNKFYRSLLAIGATAALWSVPAVSPATELHPLVITGIALDKLTTVHPMPVYPKAALALGIEGKVQVKVTVHEWPDH